MEIRLLRADEIECRIGTISDKGLSLLLYKDERQKLDMISAAVNPLAEFIRSRIEFGSEYFEPITTVYRAYLSFAAEEALPELGRTIFRNMMSMQTGVKIGKSKRRKGNNKNPLTCFEGIRLKKLYDNRQDTGMYGEEVQ